MYRTAEFDICNLQACPRGTYTQLATTALAQSDTTAGTTGLNTTSCMHCPVGTTTSLTSAASGSAPSDVCDTCIENFCENGGTCDLTSVDSVTVQVPTLAPWCCYADVCTSLMQLHRKDTTHNNCSTCQRLDRMGFNRVNQHGIYHLHLTDVWVVDHA